MSRRPSWPGVERDSRQLIEENRDRLERLAKNLLEAETLGREQIDAILDPAS
ncbi:hypothetical protein [Thiorhodovibrio winogradskyi]|uniref:hypothetical protein n=1 Tax=Thiorhodovibrio winogradskyi TaxID=77007 RepID=UPI002E296DFC|nr:hypothetical protein [Thiorhodovibrio winogradskyi]